MARPRRWGAAPLVAERGGARGEGKGTEQKSMEAQGALLCVWQTYASFSSFLSSSSLPAALAAMATQSALAELCGGHGTRTVRDEAGERAPTGEQKQPAKQHTLSVL